MKKQIKKLLIALSIFFIMIILGIALSLVSLYYFSSPVTNANEKAFSYELNVPSGTGIKAVAKELYDAHLIRSDKLFYAFARYKNAVIKAGRYTVSSNQSVNDILSLLAEGRQEYISVSIAEGLTTRQIANLLYEDGVIESVENFLKKAQDESLLNEYGIASNSFEGYLFPDTYFFTPLMDDETVIRRLVDNFFVKLDELEIDSSDKQALHDTVILASIVEREYRRKEEAPLIASVFTNRLRRGIGLESCATIVYILTEIEGRPHPEKISYEDLKIDSLYNTYKWAGLPYGPISNPGTVALNAAAKPSKTNYFYFRVKNAQTGEHVFSTSLEEHAKAGREFAIKKAATR